MPVYDAGDVMPDDYRELLTQYLLHHPEVIVFKSFRDELKQIIDKYLEMAPSAIAKLRVSMFYADEMRHGWYFYNVYRTLGLTRELNDHYVAAEAIQLDRINTWAEFSILNMLTDRVGAFAVAEWIDSSYLPLSRVAERVAFDEWGHAHMGYFHLRELLEAEPWRFDECQDILNKFWPLVLDMFGRSKSKSQQRYIDAGLRKKTNEAMRQEYIGHIKPLLAGLGFTTPPDDKDRRFV